ncbi:hypothetical protein AJ79_04607 [Helicocarpus griseus UAMH5409]|uniref:Uncharacterized protein n=1 Tax=Helicocarpus griseus UAMH5409 TaxID=1447875 RepID=A0A2B7XSI6_9EURO|nr:hypothetical protein AJ79_04607 [Helicocarpus griseus UAMH5409]
MADSNDRDRCPAVNHTNRPRQHEEENPFIAFRRYADEQFSSLLQSFIGLPSAFSSPSPRDWLYFQGEEDPARRFHHRRQAPEAGINNEVPQSNSQLHKSEKCTCGRDDSVKYSRHDRDGAEDREERYHDPFNHWWPERRRHSEHGFPSSIFESPLEHLWPFEPFGLFSHLSRFSPFSFDSLTSSNSPGWPVPYLLFSPYSPLHLERQQNMRKKSHDSSFSSLFSSLVTFQDDQEPDAPRWREAFEDLMRIENGKDMLSGDSGTVIRKEHPKDWISGMINRGSLGDHWSLIHKGPNDYFTYKNSWSSDGAQTRKGENTQPGFVGEYDDREHDMQEDKWLTELDLYEKFLNHVNEPSDEESELVSPLMGMIIEDRLRRRERLLDQRRRWEQALENEDRDAETTGELEKVPGQPGQITPEQSDMETTTTALTQFSQPSPYVTSSMTTTERRTLPDGSIQTTIKRKKRFSDGNEESNETVHVENANQSTPKSEPTNQSGPGTLERADDRDSQKKGGWFWKD